MRDLDADFEITPPVPLATLLTTLEARASTAPLAPRKCPERLPLGSIERIEALFQPRPLDPHHLAELGQALADTPFLDPVTVVDVAGSAVLVDGHHRVKAYQVAGTAEPIPVRWWPGTIRDAVLEASRENGKVKLTMTREQRMDRAWRLATALGPDGRPVFTKLQLRGAASISNGQVGRLRAAAAALREMGRDPAGIATWGEAERASRGEDGAPMTDADRTEWEDGKARDFASKLAKAFGPMLARHPEVAARAVVQHFATYAAVGQAAQGSPLASFFATLAGHVRAAAGDDEDSDF